VTAYTDASHAAISRWPCHITARGWDLTIRHTVSFWQAELLADAAVRLSACLSDLVFYIASLSRLALFFNPNADQFTAKETARSACQTPAKRSDSGTMKTSHSVCLDLSVHRIHASMH